MTYIVDLVQFMLDTDSPIEVKVLPRREVVEYTYQHKKVTLPMWFVEEKDPHVVACEIVNQLFVKTK